MNEGTSRSRPWIAPERADRDGLVGIGGDLRPATLLRAYADGVFPWFSVGDPILWWSPDPRAVIELDGLHVSKSLARTIRKRKFHVTVNQAFRQVVQGCAEARSDGTWITDAMVSAYETLHRLGHAHSVETWVRSDASNLASNTFATKRDDWTLAGGIYGVAIGAAFAGESMFYRVTDGSKVALVALVERLQQYGFVLFDVQMQTEHTTSMGAVNIPRSEYLRRLRDAVGMTDVKFDK